MSSSNGIVKWADIETDNFVKGLRYGAMRPNKSGMGKSVSVAYVDASGNDIKPILQAPKMRAPFGVSSFANEGKPASYTLVLSFPDTTVTESKMARFQRLLAAIDDRNIDEAHANQTSWFGTSGKDRSVIEDRYTRILHESDQYAPNVRTKMDVRDEVYSGMIFNNASPPARITMDDIAKGSDVIALIELGSVWIASNRFGMTVRTIQIKCFPIATLNYLAIVDDEDDARVKPDADNEYDEYHSAPHGSPYAEFTDSPAGVKRARLESSAAPTSGTTIVAPEAEVA